MANEYSCRTPEETLLYRVVQEHLEAFLAEAEEAGRAVPHFVERALRVFLDCGILARGFLRVRCKDCGAECRVRDEAFKLRWGIRSGYGRYVNPLRRAPRWQTASSRVHGDH